MDVSVNSKTNFSSQPSLSAIDDTNDFQKSKSTNNLNLSQATPGKVDKLNAFVPPPNRPAIVPRPIHTIGKTTAPRRPPSPPSRPAPRPRNMSKEEEVVVPQPKQVEERKVVREKPEAKPQETNKPQKKENRLSKLTDEQIMEKLSNNLMINFSIFGYAWRSQ